MKRIIKVFFLIVFFGFNKNTNAFDYPSAWIKLTKEANKNNYSETEKDFAKLVKKNSKNPNIYYERAFFYLKFHKDDLSIQDINKAIEIMPEKYSFYLFRADLYLQMYNEKDAIKDINTMFRMDSLIPDPHILKGQYYIQIDSLQEAYNCFNKAIMIYESNNAPCYIMSRSYSGRGKINLALNNIDASISDFTKSMAKARDNKRDNLYILRARAYLLKNEKENAFQDIGSAIATKPDTLTLSYIYAIKGNKEKFEEIVPFIRTEKFTSYCCREGVKMYNISCCYAILNNKEKALEYLEKSLELGYDKFNWILADFDMKNIKNLPEFTALIQKYQNNKQK